MAAYGVNEGLRCSDGSDVVAFDEAALQVWQSGNHTVIVHYTAIMATQRQHQWVRSKRAAVQVQQPMGLRWSQLMGLRWWQLRGFTAVLADGGACVTMGAAETLPCRYAGQLGCSMQASRDAAVQVWQLQGYAAILTSEVLWEPVGLRFRGGSRVAAQQEASRGASKQECQPRGCTAVGAAVS